MNPRDQVAVERRGWRVTGYLEAYAVVAWPLALACLWAPACSLTVLVYPWYFFALCLALLPALRLARLVYFGWRTYLLGLATAAFWAFALLNHLPI